jgi:hypothetical protein
VHERAVAFPLRSERLGVCRHHVVPRQRGHAHLGPGHVVQIQERLCRILGIDGSRQRRRSPP